MQKAVLALAAGLLGTLVAWTIVALLLLWVRWRLLGSSG
jgi:hypothetical protein